MSLFHPVNKIWLGLDVPGSFCLYLENIKNEAVERGWFCHVPTVVFGPPHRVEQRDDSGERQMGSELHCFFIHFDSAAGLSASYTQNFHATIKWSSFKLNKNNCLALYRLSGLLWGMTKCLNFKVKKTWILHHFLIWNWLSQWGVLLGVAVKEGSCSLTVGKLIDQMLTL